uniref:KASH domain-containing protein n=2 Tax=Lygus hesperus TaxID=30085 RepID=A0A0K8SMD1_LYGHE
MSRNIVIPQNEKIIQERAGSEVGDSSSSSVYVDDTLSGESKDDDVIVSLSIGESRTTDTPENSEQSSSLIDNAERPLKGHISRITLSDSATDQQACHHGGVTNVMIARTDATDRPGDVETMNKGKRDDNMKNVSASFSVKYPVSEKIQFPSELSEVLHPTRATAKEETKKTPDQMENIFVSQEVKSSESPRGAGHSILKPQKGQSSDWKLKTKKEVREVPHIRSNETEQSKHQKEESALHDKSSGKDRKVDLSLASLGSTPTDECKTTKESASQLKQKASKRKQERPTLGVKVESTTDQKELTHERCILVEKDVKEGVPFEQSSKSSTLPKGQSSDLSQEVGITIITDGKGNLPVSCEDISYPKVTTVEEEVIVRQSVGSSSSHPNRPSGQSMESHFTKKDDGHDSQRSSASFISEEKNTSSGTKMIDSDKKDVKTKESTSSKPSLSRVSPESEKNTDIPVVEDDVVREGRRKAAPDKTQKKSSPEKETTNLDVTAIQGSPVQEHPADSSRRKSRAKLKQQPAEQLDFDVNISISAKLSDRRGRSSSSSDQLDSSTMTANITGKAIVTPDGSNKFITGVPPAESDSSEMSDSVPVFGGSSDTSLVISEQMESAPHTIRTGETGSSKSIVASFIESEAEQKLPHPVPIDAKAARKAERKLKTENMIATMKDIVNNPEITSFRYYLSNPDFDRDRRGLEEQIKLLGTSKTDEYEEIRVTCVTTITEYLETILYVIFDIKKSIINGGCVPDHKLAQLKKLQEELDFLKKNIPLVCNDPKDPILAELEKHRLTISRSLTETTSLARKADEKWNKFLEEIQKLYVSLNELNDETIGVDGERIDSFVDTFDKLDSLEKKNNLYKFEIMKLIEYGRKLSCPPFRVLPQSLVQATHLAGSIEDHLIHLRNQVEQAQMLSQEYRETLVELEHVTNIAQRIVDSRVMVNSLPHLQEEMQKGRKFFVSLSHCRSILESLEEHLDNETKLQHADLHKKLHSAASDILDRAGERIGVLALAASRWTIVEQGLAEEAKWLHVAHQRAPCLTGVSTSEYEQYISVYQALSTDLDLHSGRVWKLLNSAHSLQSVISCPSLEESCDSLREQLSKLREKVNEDEMRLLSFKEVWVSFETMADKIEQWIAIVRKDKKLKKSPVDITRYWELKAEYEYYKQLLVEINTKFELAISTLPVSDEVAQRNAMAQLTDRWTDIEKLMLDAETELYSSLQPGADTSRPEQILILEKRVEEIESAFGAMHGVINSDDQLQLYLGKVQVLAESLASIQEDLSRISLSPSGEMQRLAKLQQSTKLLEDTLKNQIQGVTAILGKLGVLRKGINRVMRDQLRALAVLDQCQNSLDMDDPDVRQALVNTKGVCKALAEQWSDLLALRQDLHSIPLGIKASVNLSNYEREISKIQDSHAGLESRANALVAALESRTGLWDDYNDKLDTVKGSVREAEYMMDMLKVQGPLDYNRLVKATSRLKGVQETFEEREPTLEELRECERVLEKVVREEVGARLRGEVEEQEEAWKCTQSELVQLVTSYTKAARLWSTYATASKHLNLQPTQSVQEWNEKKEKVAELEKLADEISGEVGVEVLKPEVSALARRLEDSQEPVRLPDASQTISDPEVLLEDINKNLKKIEVRGSDPTRQLNDLLDHLTALGRTEANLSTVSKKSSDTLQIIQLLQVWERIFRETFQEYHRLSSRLVQTEERTIVLNLWQDYLNHINQLLNSNPSQHYEDLHEQNQLFKVHRDVLGCQKFLLSAQMASGDVSIIEKLSLLTNLHNETLSKIMEKQSEIQGRIKIWDEYREDQAVLLEWLKSMESERNKLKLRYITLGTLKKTMYQIEDLLERLKEGDSKEKNLHNKLGELIKCCDESLSNSLRVEFTSISHRLSNLKAALSTWKDHISKVFDKSLVYEKQFNQVHSDFVEIQNQLSDESCKAIERIPYEGLQLNLSKLQNARLVDDSLGGIKKLKDAEEALKDSLSPSDLKNMSQKCWLLEQQQCDLALQLSLANQAILDRIQLAELFDKRFDRFISWSKDVTERLDRITKLDAGQALKRLETEIHAEVSLHKREVDWLAVTGRELLSVECESSQRGLLLVKNLEILSQTWQSILSNTDGHASKLRSIVQSMSQLEIQMSDLRVSLQEIESKLLSPIILEESTKDCVNKLQNDHQGLQSEIEQKSTSVGEVLNLFELLINDCAACNISVDTDGISMAMNNLEKRWKNICIASSERKTLISQLWPKVQRIFKAAKDRRKCLQKVNKDLAPLEKQLDDSSKSSIDSISQTSSLCKAIEKDLRKLSGDSLTILEDLYRQLLNDYSLPNELLAIPEEIMDVEKSLMDRAQKCGLLASARATQHEKFVRLQSRSLTALVKCDAMLTIAELRDNSQGDLSTPEALAEYISKLESSLQAETDNLREADFLGLEIMKWCLPRDVDKIQRMIDEYQKLWKDVNDRLAALKANKGTIISSKTLSVGVEANTLKFETDQSTQVDTLGWSGPMLRKDAFISELQKTCDDFESQIRSLTHLDRLDTHKKISKYIGKCESTYELAKHLSDTLIEQCSANVSEALVDKLNRLRAEFNQVRNLAQQKQTHLKETSDNGKQSCPICSKRNWHQLETDLWRLEQCIQFAEGTLSSQPSSLPTSLEPLEIIIQDQRELLQTLDSHRSILLSMNDVGTHLAEHSDGDEKANDFRGRLAVVNQRWDIICESAASSQARLQSALIQNEEFHETINELTEWLERTEVNIRQSEPIDLNESRDVIQAKYEKFKDLKVELERCEPRIVSLEEAARQVLSDDTEVSCKRLNRLRLRLHSLIRLTNHYILVISSAFPMMSDEDSLDGPSETASREDSTETSTLVRCNRFLGRVVRASVPISAFLLLLLGAATLIPQTQPDFACTGSLTFAPVIRFPNGLPPV